MPSFPPEGGNIVAVEGLLRACRPHGATAGAPVDCAPMSNISPQASPTAAGGDPWTPLQVVRGDAACGLVLICDHATNGIPDEYAALGLSAADLRRHIAYDPGAAAVTLLLAERLGAPAVLSNFSRLLIDANRGSDDPTLIMRLSDGAIVPGNASVDADERARRIARYYAPYHQAVSETIAAAMATGVVPAIVSIHSFTPVWRGALRPWHVGILWDDDPRLAVPVIEALRADPQLVVGDNEPYSGALPNDTLNRHATQAGLAHVLVELRQDLIGDDEGAAGWAERLAEILRESQPRPGHSSRARPRVAGLKRRLFRRLLESVDEGAEAVDSGGAVRLLRGEIFPGEPPMSASFAKEQLKSIVERIERLEEEKHALAEDIKEVYAEAKGNGFDTKIVRKVISLRKQDAAERSEQEALLDLYMHALGMAVAPAEAAE